MTLKTGSASSTQVMLSVVLNHSIEAKYKNGMSALPGMGLMAIGQQQLNSAIQNQSKLSTACVITPKFHGVTTMTPIAQNSYGIKLNTCIQISSLLLVIVIMNPTTLKASPCSVMPMNGLEFTILEMNNAALNHSAMLIQWNGINVFSLETITRWLQQLRLNSMNFSKKSLKTRQSKKILKTRQIQKT